MSQGPGIFWSIQTTTGALLVVVFQYEILIAGTHGGYWPTAVDRRWLKRPGNANNGEQSLQLLEGSDGNSYFRATADKSKR